MAQKRPRQSIDRTSRKKARTDGTRSEDQETKLQREVKTSQEHGLVLLNGLSKNPHSEEGEAAPARDENLGSYLELLRVLRNHEEPQNRKLELAYQFVELRQRHSISHGRNGPVGGKEWNPPPYLVSFLSEWVQTALISSAKVHPVDSNTHGQQDGSATTLLERITRPAHLDERYWTILKWCLLVGIQGKAGNISVNIMRPISCVVAEVGVIVSRDGLCSLAGDTVGENARYLQSNFGGVRIKDGSTKGLLKVLADVVKLLLFAYERSFRPNLDLWASSALASLKIVFIVFSRKDSTDILLNESSPLFQLIDIVTRGFAKFLKSCSSPRKVFQSVLEKLLETLLNTLMVLMTSLDGRIDSLCPVGKKKLLNTVEEILKYSLFHPAHLGGYLNVCNMLNQTVGPDDKNVMIDRVGLSDGPRNRKLSYHKLLFQQLEYFRKEGKVSLLRSSAWIFRTFIQELKAQTFSMSATLFDVKYNGASKNVSTLKVLTSPDDQLDGQKGLEHGQAKKGFNSAVNRKAVQEAGCGFFVFFAELVCPLVKEIDDDFGSFSCLDKEISISKLVHVRFLLAATSNLLLVANEEHVYVPTEDTAVHAHLNFIKVVCNVLINLGTLLPKMLPKSGFKLSVETVSENKEAQWSGEGLCLVIEVLREVIGGIGHILEMEYRVIEHRLMDLWTILLSTVAVPFTSVKGLGKSVASQSGIAVAGDAVRLASRIIEIFSELRQIDRPIISLCDFLRQFSKSEGSIVTMFPVKCCRKAIELTLLSPKFMDTIAAAMKKVPEGQVASFVNLLTKDGNDTLQMLMLSGVHTAQGHHQILQPAVKALTEIYICSLEHANVTASNCIQVGMALRDLMNSVIKPLLSLIVDSIAGGNAVIRFSELLVKQENGNMIDANSKQCFHLSNGMDESCSDNKNNNPVIVLLWEVILRLYVSTKCLHRQCITLMPPKAARKASAAIDDLTIPYFTGQFASTEPMLHDDGFFSCAGKGSAFVLDTLNGIEECLEVKKYKKFESLSYTLHCIAMQSLVDLTRQIKSVKFILNESELAISVALQKDQGQGQATDQLVTYDGEGSPLFEKTKSDKKKLRKHLKKLMLKASSLSSFLVRWIHALSGGNRSWKSKPSFEKGVLCFEMVELSDDKLLSKLKNSSKKGDLHCNKQEGTMDFLKANWNKVVGTLDDQTLLVARWGLLCQHINVWSEFASVNDLRRFIKFMLGKTLQCQEYTGDHNASCNAHSFTSDLLKDALFYEQKSIRGVFIESLCQELEQIWYTFGDSGLSGDCFLGTSLSDGAAYDVKQLSQSMIKFIENKVGMCGGFINVKCGDGGGLQDKELVGHQFSKLKTHTKQRLLSNSHGMMGESQKMEQRCKDSTYRSLHLKNYVHLMNLVTRLPKGYIEAGSAAALMRFILMLERSIVMSFLHLRSHCLEGPTDLNRTVISSKVLHFLEFLLACRRSIESLLLSNHLTESSVVECSSTLVLLHDSASLYWPLLSIHAVAACFYEIIEEHTEDGMSALGEDVLASILRCTTGVFTFFSQNLVKDLLDPLLVTCGDKESLGAAMDHGTGAFDILEPFVSTLTVQMRNSLEYMKHVIFEGSKLSELPKMVASYKVENLQMSTNAMLNAYGAFASMGAVSSFLWSITTTLESLDEKCHSDKDGSTKWQGQLPDMLLSYINTAESLLTESLQEVLSPNKEVMNQELPSGDNRLVGLQMASKDLYDAVSKNSEHEESMEAILDNSAKDLVDVQSTELTDVIIEDFEDQQEHRGNSILEMLNKHQEEDKDSDESDACKVDNINIKTGKKTNLAWKLCAPNVTQEERSSTAPSFTDFSDMSDLQVCLFREMLSGQRDKQSHFLGELFMAMAAIVRLRSLFHSPNVNNKLSGLSSHLWTSSMSLHVGVANRIMSEAVTFSQPKGSGWLILMLGTLKYMESVGSFLPYTRPALSPTAFVKLINAHLSLLGTLLTPTQVMEDKNAHEELKHSIHNSFMMFLRKPLGLHFRIALQTVERALLGLEGGSTQEDGWEAGWKFNTIINAGVECLSISLDAVSGPKRLQMLAKYSSSFLSAIFNLIMNSQKFWYTWDDSEHGSYLASCREDIKNDSIVDRSLIDATTAVLKSIEILVSISSREVIFPMKASHVAQAMSCPADFFKPFYQTNMARLKLIQSFSSTSEGCDSSDYEKIMLIDLSSSDGLLKLYTMCCKLLRSLLRHRTRESGHCVALLGDSVRALLFFLELMELSILRKQKNVYLQSAVSCASWLRRVYEEVAEHKETFGKYCGHLLSDYICVISGYGITARGLSREIEGTIRAGAYALVDACSADDLQQLHAVLGEGPRRSALTMLRRDYEHHFKYTGKV